MIKTVYVVRKGTDYLLNYANSGIKELDRDGRLSPVLTCLWGDSISDAMVFDAKSAADTIRKSVGANRVEKIDVEVGE